MKTSVSKSANTSSVPFDVDNDYSFIYKGEKKPLFYISLQGEVVKSNGMPVYKDRTSKHEFVMGNMYSIYGIVKICPRSNAAFLLPLHCVSTEPRTFAVSGTFTASHDVKAPLFRVENFKIVPTNSKEGLVVFAEPSRSTFVGGRTYKIEGLIVTYPGKHFGTFESRSVEAINLTTGEALKTLTHKAERFMHRISVDSIEELVKEAFNINEAPVWAALTKGVNQNANTIRFSEELIDQIMTQNIDRETRIKLAIMKEKYEQQVA